MKIQLINGLYCVLLSLLCFSLSQAVADELPNPDEENLANFHLLDETCAGQCHEGEAPSDSLEFEYNSCIECHDVLGQLEGRQHNLKHWESEQMDCVTCHLPHEEFNPIEACIDCHEEDDEELSDFYSKRLTLYNQLYPIAFHNVDLFKIKALN